MKYLILLSITLCAFGCNATPIGSSSQIKLEQFFIFIDKSASVNFSDAAIKNKINQKLDEIWVVEPNKSFNISVYYLHGNTNNSSIVFNQSIPGLKPKGDEESHLEFVLRTKKWKKTTNTILSDCKNKIIGCLDFQNTSRTKNYTDIFSSLELIANKRQKGSATHVLFLSDMKHDSKTQLFTKSVNIKNYKTDAKNDFNKIQSNYDNSNNLKGIQFFAITPVEASSTNTDVLIMKYWTSIFSLLGSQFDYF